MANTLTGGILAGTVFGTITDVKSCTVAGIEINDINFAANDDVGAVTSHIPGTITEGPITATIVYSSTIHATLRAKALLRTTDTWTYTDGAGTAFKWSGVGFISSVSGVDSDPDSEDTYTVTFVPSGKWTYGAA